MLYEDIPAEELHKIVDKLASTLSVEARNIMARTSEQWKNYTLETKYAMYTHAMCVLATVVAEEHPKKDSIDYVIMSSLLAQVGNDTLDLFLRPLAVRMYEQNLTPDIDELKRIMEL